VIEVFKCPQCGASITYEGGPEPTVSCGFCGSTVVVPEELRAKVEPAPGADLGEMVTGLPLDKLAELKRLVQSGQKIEAVKLFRETFGVGLKQAKDAVEALEAEQPVVFTSARAGPPGAAEADQSARIAEILQLSRSGRKIEAIKLFRQTFGVGLKQAKDAVEALEAGQSLDVSQFPPQSPRASSDKAMRLVDVREHVRAGRKIEAIKLYREIYGVGLKEAKDAVEAMSPGAGPPVPAAQARRAVRTAGRLGTALILLVGAGIAAFVLFMVFGMPFRMSASYTQALEAAQSHPAVIAALGAPVEASFGVITGELSCGGDSCRANYFVPIHGSKKGGQLRVYSRSEGATFGKEGTWRLDAVVAVNGGEVIELTSSSPPVAEATPAPTLSPAQIDATAGAVARATNIVRATREAEAAAATATAQAGAARAATATAEAQVIADSIIAAQASWPSAIAESFADNQLGWPVGLEEDDYIAVNTEIADGKYIWAVNPKDGGSYENMIPEAGGAFAGFYAAVDVELVGGADDGGYAYGLVFRRVDDDYGFFGLARGGRFRILVVHDTGIYTLIDYSGASAIRPGQPNRLAVRALGSDFVFEINDQVVWYLSDDSLDPGQIGLGVDVTSAGGEAKVEFTNFEVRAPQVGD
jgi:ribosomal protein L7/L12